MRIIDTHLHTSQMRGGDLTSISMGGVESAIALTENYFLGVNSGDTILRYWRRLLEFEVSRCKSYGIELFIGLAVPYYGVTSEGIVECLKELPKYIEAHRDRVVAIGETGFNIGNEDEVEVFRSHLKIAKELDLPIIVHTACPYEPEDVVLGTTEQAIEIIVEENFPIEKAVLDETALDTVEMRLNSGAMVNLGICHDKLRPEDVVYIVKKYHNMLHKMTISSMLGNSGGSYFSCPRAVVAMRMAGLKRAEIEKVTWENAKTFYNLPLD